MATFATRNGSTRAQIRMRGVETSATFDTETEARAWAARIEDRIKKGEAITDDGFGENPTVIALMDKYLKEVSIKKRSSAFDITCCDRLRRIDVFHKRLSNFTTNDLRSWRDMRLNGDAAKGIKAVRSGSVLRELNFISAMFTHAIKEWNMPLKQNPCSLIQWPKKGKSRHRRVSDDEIAKIMGYLDEYDGKSAPTTAKQWAAWGILFALETAMRRGEFMAMKWKYVHKAERYVHLPLTKNGNMRNVPLSRAALDLLNVLPEGAPEDDVIPLALTSITAYFWEACKTLGLRNLRLHDLRHEATTRIAKKLKPRGGVDEVSLIKLSAITGHESINMLKIYFNPTATEMAEEMDRLDALA
ncbi:tyrosine-type recombinase/integrase [Burkholderia pseudomallei]